MKREHNNAFIKKLLSYQTAIKIPDISQYFTAVYAAFVFWLKETQTFLIIFNNSAVITINKYTNNNTQIIIHKYTHSLLSLFSFLLLSFY